MVAIFLGSLLQISAQAEISLGQVWGTAWTIGNIIVGTTTLTPAYKVESYDWYYRTGGLTQGAEVSVKKKMKWDKVTGLHFFHTKTQPVASPMTETTEPFMINSVNKLNLTCTVGNIPGQTYEYTITENHSEWVWLAQVETTGFWPDDGPWTVWLKAAGYKTECGNPFAKSDYFFWVPAEVTKTQGKSVSVGKANSILTYPFYLAKDFYK